MKKIRSSVFIYIISCYILVLFGTSIAAESPKAAISSTIDSILETLRDKTLAIASKKEERRDKIKTLLKNRFDFKEMARRSLAKHWKKISAGEKKEFVSIFSDLLELSYIGKIEAYTDEKVTYDKEVVKGKGKYAMVSTTIVTKSVNIPINYKVRNKEGKWWIYDVVIEGVSFVSTYRSQYNKIIIKESFARLVEAMKRKLEETKSTL